MFPGASAQDFYVAGRLIHQSGCWREENRGRAIAQSSLDLVGAPHDPWEWKALSAGAVGSMLTEKTTCPEVSPAVFLCLHAAQRGRGGPCYKQ